MKAADVLMSALALGLMDSPKQPGTVSNYHATPADVSHKMVCGYVKKQRDRKRARKGR